MVPFEAVVEEAAMRYVASDIMSRNVICVSKDTDLRDLAKLFLAKGITGAPVLDASGDLCGVISQTDLLFYHLTRDDELTTSSDFYSSVRVEGRPLATGFQIEDINTATVDEVMTPVVHAVSAKTPVTDIARLMTRRHIHRVIVRDGKKVAGIISALDVLRVIGGPSVSRRAAKPKAKARKRAPRRNRLIGRAKPARRRRAA